MRNALWYLVVVLCVALLMLCARFTPASNIILPAQLEAIVQIRNTDIRCTGFIVRRGLVLTAGHCIRPTDLIQDVWFSDGAIAKYKVVSFESKEDCAHDWGLVMVDTGKRRPFTFGRRPQLKDTVYRIGYPKGFTQQVVRVGRVTNLANDYIEMTNEASPGESGAPLLNHLGQIVGILDCFDTYRNSALGGEARLFRDTVAQVSK